MKVTERINHHEKKTAVALGIFDGIHIGHTAVIKNTINSEGYTPVVLTFGGKVKGSKKLVTDFTKTRLLEGMGVREYITLEFEQVRDMSTGEFVEKVLAEKLNAARVCCGYNFRFGKNATGDANELERLCNTMAIETMISEQVSFEGQPISSTAIRALVESGDIVTANKMLGHPFGYEYEVVSGRKLGRVLGTPTINQHFEDDFCVPRFGVYASYSVVEGKMRASVTNIGVKPTVGSAFALSETWIPGFSGDLYGENVEVRLLEFMRPEERFDSIDILKENIISDGERSKMIFQKYLK